MTSKPASRAATAIISEPFEWPSSPGLPTTIRGRPPCRAPHAATRARTASTRAPSRPRRWPSTPVGGRYSPNTSRSASAHSPAVRQALGLAAHQGGLHVARLDRGERAAQLADAGDLGGGGLLQLRDLGGDHRRAVEQVGVLE